MDVQESLHFGTVICQTVKSTGCRHIIVIALALELKTFQATIVTNIKLEMRMRLCLFGLNSRQLNPILTGLFESKFQLGRGGGGVNLTPPQISP